MVKFTLPGFSDRYSATSGGYVVPDHTQESLHNYIVYGWQPGGFVESMLSMNLERALYTADMANKLAIWDIGRWIVEYAPRESWGSYQAIDIWINDVDGCRSKYVNQLEKEYIEQALKGEHRDERYEF